MARTAGPTATALGLGHRLGLGGLGLLGRGHLGVEGIRRRLPRRRERLCLLLGHDALDVGVDAVERALVLGGQIRGLGLRRLQVVAGGGGGGLLLLERGLVACSWFWAVCRLSTVVVTLPVAMEEYSDRMPVVLGFDENIWVTWLLVPLLV